VYCSGSVVLFAIGSDGGGGRGGGDATTVGAREARPASGVGLALELVSPRSVQVLGALSRCDPLKHNRCEVQGCVDVTVKGEPAHLASCDASLAVNGQEVLRLTVVGQLAMVAALARQKLAHENDPTQLRQLFDDALDTRNATEPIMEVHTAVHTVHTSTPSTHQHTAVHTNTFTGAS